MAIIKGGCRCGHLSYELQQAPLYAAYCHCSDCRRRNSSPCTSFFMANLTAVQIKGDSHVYTEKGGSGAPLEHHRCTQCGTVVYAQVHALNNIAAIPAETLQDKSFFKPNAHVWVSSKEDWFEIKDDLPQLPGPPRLPKSLLKG